MLSRPCQSFPRWQGRDGPRKHGTHHWIGSLRVGREIVVAQTQLICVAVAIVVLLGLSFGFGWRQLAVLRRLREVPELPADEGREQRRQAHRRLVSCGLLALLALL